MVSVNDNNSGSDYGGTTAYNKLTLIYKYKRLCLTDNLGVSFLVRDFTGFEVWPLCYWKWLSKNEGRRGGIKLGTISLFDLRAIGGIKNFHLLNLIYLWTLLSSAHSSNGKYKEISINITKFIFLTLTVSRIWNQSGQFKLVFDLRTINYLVSKICITTSGRDHTYLLA